MKTRLLNVLAFLRLIEDGGISLTNIAVIIVLVKVVCASAVSFADMGALLAVISSYSFKRYHVRSNKFSKEPKIEVIANLDKVKLDSMFNDLERLKLAAGFKKNVTAENIR